MIEADKKKHNPGNQIHSSRSYGTYFGDFHWHSSFSDGTQPLEDALARARDFLGLDFAAPADHVTAAGEFTGGSYEKQKKICMQFNDPGNFCTLPAVEFTHRHGHLNIIAESFSLMEKILRSFKDEMDAESVSKADRFPLDVLSRICPPENTILRPNHPAIDSGKSLNPDDGRTAWYSFNWPLVGDKSRFRLAEIITSECSHETEEEAPGWRTIRPGMGGSIRTGLCRGYRPGFTGASDEHAPWPCPDRSAVTAVQAETLDTRSIFRALYGRRCYATTGARIIADATLNGHPMGSELKLSPDTGRSISMTIRATAPLERVEIISSDSVVACFKPGGEELFFSEEWSDERPGRHLDNVYYYVRARQEDGHCLWISPFWVDLP